MTGRTMQPGPPEAKANWDIFPVYDVFGQQVGCHNYVRYTDPEGYKLEISTCNVHLATDFYETMCRKAKLFNKRKKKK